MAKSNWIGVNDEWFCAILFKKWLWFHRIERFAGQFQRERLIPALNDSVCHALKADRHFVEVKYKLCIYVTIFLFPLATINLLSFSLFLIGLSLYLSFFYVPFILSHILPICDMLTIDAAFDSQRNHLCPHLLFADHAEVDKTPKTQWDLQDAP